MVGRTGAVVLTALAHAGYKTALFVWPPEALACDLATNAVYTAGGGILIGALRAISRSVIPSVFAHVVFDLRMHRPQGLGWRGFRRTGHVSVLNTHQDRACHRASSCAHV